MEIENLKSTQIKIFNELIKEPEKFFTASEISSRAKMPYTTAFYRLEDLVKLNLLKKKKAKAAKTGLYSLNYKNPIVRKLSELSESSKTKELLDQNHKLKVIMDDVLKSFSNLFTEIIVCLILFGSHVKGTEIKTSDIDTLFIVREGTKSEYERWPNKIHELCDKISSRHTKKISPFILSTKDFKEGLTKKQTLVIEIYKNHAILFGYEFYIKEVFDWLETKELP